MSHELNFTDGRADLFAVVRPETVHLDTPWHREGTLLTEAPSFDGALALARMDYPISKRPYLRPVSPDVDTSGYVESGDAYYVQRDDTGAVLGSAGSTYEVVTNEQAFAPLRPLVDTGVLKLETGGVLRDGADAWLLGKWDLNRFGPLAQEVFGDEVLPYATVCANHSGRRGILLGNTPIRVVCANTLGAAERDGLSQWETIVHTTGARLRLVDAAERIFARVIEQHETLALHYHTLRGCALPLLDFQRLVQDVVAPDPTTFPTWNPDAKMAASVVARNERKRSALLQLWPCGKGHEGELTCWTAYNATVEALDHDLELWPTKAGCYRTASLLSGTLATAKQAVLTGLLDFAQSL